MPFKEPQGEVTLYFKSGNVVTIPIDSDGGADWHNSDGKIASLNIYGMLPPFLGFSFSVQEIEAFTVKQV